MFSKAAVALLGALATYQGASAQAVKPVDQATEEGILNPQQVESVEQMCGTLNPIQDSTLPCEVEQYENSLLAAAAQNVKNKQDKEEARAWFGKWKANKRFHQARRCCIDCKLKAWEGNNSLAAGMTPSQAKWWRDTFYDAEAYSAAWEAEKKDFSMLLNEWAWRQSKFPYDKATIENTQSRSEVGYQAVEDCGSLPEKANESIVKDISNTTVIVPATCVPVITYQNARTNVTQQVDKTFYLQAKWIVAIVDSLGNCEGTHFDAPAVKIDEVPSVNKADLPARAIPVNKCAVCDSTTRVVSPQVVFEQPPPKAVEVMEKEVQQKGAAANSLVLAQLDLIHLVVQQTLAIAGQTNTQGKQQPLQTQGKQQPPQTQSQQTNSNKTPAGSSNGPSPATKKPRPLAC
ncbi:hypothetical protein CDD81_6403 [Ophiocordyceps australis]|uniref:Uncharacterized protein n=1 Tax=Ophiocordyceps australis TaxID=1399860 RepID=A0A2C5XHN3_9HYPO|nr:hypothetical protein CDD81_6403 [Ophiocordyceps australis]